MAVMVKKKISSAFFSIAAAIIGTIFCIIPHIIVIAFPFADYTRMLSLVFSWLLSGALFFPIVAGFCRCSMAKLCGDEPSFSLLFACFGKDYFRTAFYGILIWFYSAASLFLALLPFAILLEVYIFIKSPLVLIATSIFGGAGFVGWLFFVSRYAFIPVLLFDRSLGRKDLFLFSKKLIKGIRLSLFWTLFRYFFAFCLVVPIPFCIGRIGNILAEMVSIQCRAHHIYQP